MADQAANDKLEQALRSDLPRMYVNGFTNGVGPGDIVTAFELNGQPALVLNMSFTIAKTYSMLLGQLIARLEADTGREIMTTQTIADAASKSGEG